MLSSIPPILLFSITLLLLVLLSCGRDANSGQQSSVEAEAPKSGQLVQTAPTRAALEPVRIGEDVRGSGLPSAFLVQGTLDGDGELVLGKLDFNSLPQAVKDAYFSGSLASATGWEQVAQPELVYKLDRQAGVLTRASQSIWSTGVKSDILTIGSDRFRTRGRTQEPVPWPDGTLKNIWPAPYAFQLPDGGWAGYGTYVPRYKASVVVIAGDKSTSGSDMFGGSWSFREGPYYLSVNVAVGEKRSKTTRFELVTLNEEGGFTCMYTPDGRWCVVISGTARELWIVPLGAVLDELGAERI